VDADAAAVLHLLLYKPVHIPVLKQVVQYGEVRLAVDLPLLLHLSH
jgi:hypothetical protein